MSQREGRKTRKHERLKGLKDKEHAKYTEKNQKKIVLYRKCSGGVS